MSIFRRKISLGTTAPIYQTHIFGASQTTAALSNSGNTGGALYVQDSGASNGNGGAVVFGVGQGKFASIKALGTSGSGNSTGDLAFSTRNATSDTALTERLRISQAGNVGIGTSAPTATLHVHTGTNRALRINDTGSAVYLGASTDDGSSGVPLTIAAGALISLNSGGFPTMTIASGNVGMVTSSKDLILWRLLTPNHSEYELPFCRLECSIFG